MRSIARPLDEEEGGRAASLPPLGDDEWPADINDLREGFAGQLNVYRVMAHQPALLRAWAPLRAHVVLANALGRVRAEVVILRAAFRLGSAYEWAHHVARARRCGLEEGRIVSLRGSVQGMNPEDALLATAVDELLADARLTPDTKRKLARLVGSKGMLDLMATLGFYSTLGFILKSFDVPFDEDVARQADRALPDDRAE